MLLRHVGETCTIDFHDLLGRWYADFERKQDYYKNKGESARDLTRSNKRAIHDLIKLMYTDFLDFNSKWQGQRWQRELSEYRKQLGNFSREFTKPDQLIRDSLDFVADHLVTYVDLPTWHVIDLNVRNGYIKIELGEDYRITQWEEEHGDEYNRR